MKQKARRIPAIARWINANLADFGFQAVVREGVSELAAQHTPYGFRIVVRRHGQVILDHNGGASKSRNSDVEEWLQGVCTALRIPAENDHAFLPQQRAA